MGSAGVQCCCRESLLAGRWLDTSLYEGCASPSKRVCNAILPSAEVGIGAEGAASLVGFAKLRNTALALPREASLLCPSLSSDDGSALSVRALSLLMLPLSLALELLRLDFLRRYGCGKAFSGSPYSLKRSRRNAVDKSSTRKRHCFPDCSQLVQMGASGSRLHLIFFERHCSQAETGRVRFLRSGGDRSSACRLEGAIRLEGPASSEYMLIVDRRDVLILLKHQRMPSMVAFEGILLSRCFTRHVTRWLSVITAMRR